MYVEKSYNSCSQWFPCDKKKSFIYLLRAGMYSEKIFLEEEGPDGPTCRLNIKKYFYSLFEYYYYYFINRSFAIKLYTCVHKLPNNALMLIDLDTRRVCWRTRGNTGWGFQLHISWWLLWCKTSSWRQKKRIFKKKTSKSISQRGQNVSLIQIHSKNQRKLEKTLEKTEEQQQPCECETTEDGEPEGWSHQKKIQKMFSEMLEKDQSFLCRSLLSVIKGMNSNSQFFSLCSHPHTVLGQACQSNKHKIFLQGLMSNHWRKYFQMDHQMIFYKDEHPLASEEMLIWLTGCPYLDNNVFSH